MDVIRVVSCVSGFLKKLQIVNKSDISFVPVRLSSSFVTNKSRSVVVITFA